MSGEERPWRVHVATERWDGDRWVGTCNTRHIVRARSRSDAVTMARDEARARCVAAHDTTGQRVSPMLEHATEQHDAKGIMA